MGRARSPPNTIQNGPALHLHLEIFGRQLEISLGSIPEPEPCGCPDCTDESGVTIVCRLCKEIVYQGRILTDGELQAMTDAHNEACEVRNSG